MVVKIERKRYLLIEFDGHVPEDKYLVRELRKKLSLLGGQISLATSSMHLIDIKDKFAIIRATHTSRDMVEAAIQLLELNNTSVVVRTVTGTIAKINQLLETEFVDNEEIDDLE